MRLTGRVVIVLIALGWFIWVHRLPGGAAEPTIETPWRRARNGWERAYWLHPSTPISEPGIHPAVVGAMQLLVSVLALTAFPSHDNRGRAGAGPPA